MLLHATGLVPLGFIERLDHFIYDVRLRATMPRTLDERIVIVDIDEKSLADVGRWPWGRQHMAQLTRELFERQRVQLVGFDIVFAEPDHSSGLAQLEQLARGELKDVPAFQARLEQLRAPLDHDARFAQALRGRPVVLGYYFTSDRGGGTSGVLPAPVMDRAALAGRPVRFTRWDGYGANLPVLAEAAPHAGFFNSIQDPDGLVRSVPLVAEFDGKHYESIALAMFRSLHGWPPVQPGFPAERWLPRSYQGLDSIQLRTGGPSSMAIPVDARVGALVPYRGPGGPQGGSFRYVAASDVLQGRLPPAELSGKIVLVGTTAPGMFDLRSTPVGQVYPGVEAHANLLSGLLDGRLPVQPDYALGYEVLMLLLVGIGLALLLPQLGAVAAALAATVALLTILAVDTWLYVAAGLVMPSASLLLLAIALFAAHVGYGYFVEERAQRALTRLYGHYVPAELVAEMARQPVQGNGMDAENKPLTVLFCDIRNFSQLSGSLQPQQVRELLNLCFLRMTQVIRDHRGTLDKYIGDALMAFWGAPLDEPRHAELAVQAAQAMTRAVAPLNAELQARGLPEIAVGIGLNTGMMWVGDMGSDLRRSYTVMGDAVTLASRVEALARSYGVDVLAADGTRDAANHLPWQEVDRVQIKGKGRPVTLYTPLHASPDSDKALASELMAWHMALKAYRMQDWDQADVQLLNLQRLNPEKRLYSLFAYRVAHLRKHPPPAGWDGAFEAR
nr:adenylate/guanylate cyclase domain-containing protein [Caldimonas mangrovi]